MMLGKDIARIRLILCTSGVISPALNRIYDRPQTRQRPEERHPMCSFILPALPSDAAELKPLEPVARPYLDRWEVHQVLEQCAMSQSGSDPLALWNTARFGFTAAPPSSPPL